LRLYLANSPQYNLKIVVITNNLLSRNSPTQREVIILIVHSHMQLQQRGNENLL